jgi:hypothetical protein
MKVKTDIRVGRSWEPGEAEAWRERLEFNGMVPACFDECLEPDDYDSSLACVSDAFGNPDCWF